MAEQSVTADDANYSWGGKIGGGIVAGVLAATLWMGFMMAYSGAIGDGPTMPLRALGALVYGIEALVAGTVATVTGAGIELGFSIVLGILFGLAMSRRTFSSAGNAGGNPGRYRDLVGDESVCATVHGPHDGGAGRADADRIFRCARTIRDRAWHDASFHSRVQPKAPPRDSTRRSSTRASTI
jgi:hypothetical protein